MSSSPHFRAWQPTRSFSHDVTTTASSTSTAAEQQQKRQLASQLQYLHELDQMHRQRIRDIQRLHEQQQLFTSPHHRHSRHYKPAAPSRPYHDVGSASHETYSQQQHQQYQQQHAHGPPPSSPQATAGSKGQGMVAQPITPQPNMPRAEVSAAAWSNEQHAPRPDHYVRRFQLAQRMLQIQQILHTQRIQQLHFMHKLSKVQQQQNQQQSVPELVVSTPTLPSSPSSPTATNTSTVVALPQCKSKGDLFQDKRGSQGIPTVETRRVSSVPDISRISLPNVDTIRKQRRQRLKAQARLRQAAAERSLKAAGAATEVDVKNDGSDAHSTVKEETISTGNTLVGSVTSGALSDKGDEAVKLASFSSVYTPTLTLPLASAQQRQINKSGDAALRLSDCSISRARLKTKAELAYKKQLVRQQTLQHHMIQDHTNRYRIYQAYCLLQRAREAQAMDELKVIELKQVQTRAWVESLRSQADMEVPK
ncbi:hypothetical protein BGZ73_002725 [Actinomortierella ambigua]|nr:hypothetical protein BGZ73_002725 [Actinomortierella ambigua]